MKTFIRYVFFVTLLCYSNTRLLAQQPEQPVQLPELTMTGKAVTALVEKKLPIQFSYGKEASDLLERKVTFARSPLPLREILETMKAATGLSYNMAANNTVILRPGAPAPRQGGHGSISGKITDADGLPLALASVQISGTTTGTTTDEKGYFLLKANAGNYTLDIRFTGFVTAHKTIVVTANATTQVQVKLQQAAGNLSQVNVSGVKQKSATATRSLMQIQDIPQSIVVIGQKVMKEQGAFDLTTITRNISGLNYTGNYSGAGSYEFFNARGFDLSGSQNYRWNGQMIWNLGDNYGDNIEQVEFLKGPTSILFGDVAPGGVLNFTTKKPLSVFTTDVNLKIGQWGLVRPSVDISGPINESKTLRYRLNTSYEQSNSFRDHVSEQRFLVAPTIAWDITPKLSLDVEAVFRNSSSTDDAGIVSPDGTVAGLHKLSPHLYLGEPSRKYLYSDQGYFANLNWQISKNWRLRSTNYYGYTTNRPFGLWPSQPDEEGNIERDTYGYHQWLKNFSTSLDINGTFYTGSVKHNVLAGFDYQDTHYRFTSEGELSFFDSTNIYHPVYGQTPNEPVPGTYLPFVSLITRVGFYAQDQLMFFNEKLHLLAGIRAGRTRQGNHYFQGELAGTDYEGYQDDIVSKNVITPRVGLVYKPQDNLSLYASWSKGYEINSPDVFAQNYKDFSNPPPTYSTQWELGAKASLLQSKLGASFTLFRIDKKDPYGYTYVEDSTGNIDYDKYNVYYEGHHRSEGIELDIDGKISNTLSVTAGAAYTDTKVVKDPGYPTGNQLPNAPRYTGNIWLNYNAIGRLKGVSAGAGFFYKGKFFSSITNDPGLIVPSNYTLDVSAGYTFKNFGAQLNVSNLTNRISYLNPWAFLMYDVQPLRRAVLTLSYHFAKTPKKK